MEEVEKLLLMSSKEKQLASDRLLQPVICEKVTMLHVGCLKTPLEGG